METSTFSKIKQSLIQSRNWFLLFLLSLGSVSLFGQTLPSLYNGWPADYTFTSWAATEPATTYPANMRLWRGTGDVSPVGVFGLDYTAVYNGTSGARFNGLGASGIAFNNTGGAGIGTAVVGLNLTGRSSAQVSWTAGTVTVGPRQYILQLQYRIGSGSWITVAGTDYPSNATAGHSSSFGPTTLPAACDNQPSVYVRWAFFYVGPATGARPVVRLDEVNISSSAFSGPVTPIINVSSSSLDNVVVANGAGASPSVTYTVSGTDLSGNLIVTPPVGIEMSVVGAGGPYTFNNSTPISFISTLGTVASSPVWARISSGSPIGIYSSNIIASSAGATSVNTTFNGQVFSDPSVVINQGYNASGNNPAGTEWYELLTLQSVDLRNWVFRDYSGGSPNTPDQLTFNNIPFWSSIPAGTYIVIYQPGFTTPVEDLDPSDDGIIKIQACNTTYFTQTAPICAGSGGNSMAMNATQDVLQILNAASTVVHSMEWNSSATEYSGLNIVRYPKVFLNNSILAPAGIAATASTWMVNTNGIDDYYNNANVAESGLQTPANSTEGTANDATQRTWVCGTVRGIIEPTVAASALNCTGVTSNEITLNWTAGNGSRRLIVQRAGATAAVAPVDGTNYLTGGNTGTGNNIIYLGTGVSTISLSSLSPSTSYTFDVYEISGNGECIDYAPAASITQSTAAGVGITLDPVVGTPFCVSPTSLSATLTADFATIGTFNVGNTFTVQLSSAAGSFASPINIGSGSATSIVCNIPAGTTAGTGYLVRVVSSDPVTNSTTQAITINAAPVNVSGQSALAGTSAATVNWTNPTAGCFDDIMVVAKATAFTAAVPTGNTLNSNSNSFADVTNDLFDGGVVVYKGTSAGQVITGLNNGTAYTFKIFTRTGNDWSNGVVVSATPVFSFSPGDIQFLGMNTAAPDGFSFVTWVAIPAGTQIKFMDNGFLAGVSANATNNCRCTENVMTWTAPAGGVAIGNVVNILDLGGANASANVGTCTGALNGLSNAGDQVFAFTGPTPANTNPATFAGTLIAGINLHPSLNFLTTGVASAQTSYLPTELAAVPEAFISFNSNPLNVVYTGSRSNQTTFAAYKPVVDANANWVAASTATNPFSTTNFTLSAGLPDVQLNVSATSGTEAAGTVITLSAVVIGTTLAPETVDVTVTGTGITGTDYVLSNATITIPAGVNPTGTVTFTILNDLDAEGIETAVVTISNPSAGIELGTFVSRDIAIADNDVPNLVITEIMYDGPGLDNEWIEFHNAGSTSITINNLFQLSSSNNPWTYTFTGSTVMAPGAYFTVQVGTSGSFPFAPTFVAFATGTDRLQNTSSTITLRFNSLTVDAVTYGNGAPWPGALANGGGSSVSLNQPNLDNAIGSNWGACFIGGTPNAANINCNSNIFYTVTSGNLTDQIWSTLPSGPAIFANFSSGTDLVVQNGHTVLMNNSSAVPVRNLTINGGTGRVWRNSTVAVNMAYFSLYGNLVNNGVIGNGNTFDAVGLNIEGTNCTISGSGIFNLGRLRKTENINLISTVTINTNTSFNLRFPGTSIYNNFTGATTFNVIIPTGRLVSVFGDGSTNGDVSMDGVDGLGIGERSGTITVNGTLRVLGRIYALTNNTNPASTTTIAIGSAGSVITRDIDLRIDGAADVGFGMNINAGGRLTVNGTMRNLAGVFNSNGGLTLTSGASLLHGIGTPGLGADPGAEVTGNVTVRRVGTTAIGSYNFWSSPVSGSNLSSIGNGGIFQGSALSTYAYDPNAANGFSVEGYRAGWMSQSLSGAMTPAAGYITTTAGNATFVGPVNNGNISLPLVQGAFTRFNLVGNPYPCAINAGSFLTANASQIAGAVYFWDDDESQGADYSTSDYVVTNTLGTSGSGGNGNATNFLGNIASGQGFFVEALPTGTQVSFTNAMRNNNNAFFFDANSFQKMWVKVSNNEGLQNETLIAFLDEATDNPDHQFDAHKLPGNAFISIYTTNETENFAIQAWKNITNSRVIGLGVDASVAGTHSIGIPRIENIDATTLVYLEDTETDAYHNLRNGDYQFEVSEPITGAGRFFIHFVEGVQVEANAETCNTNDGSIQLNGTPNIWSYQVVNSNNETVAEGAVSVETSINNLAAGTYAIRFHSFDGYMVSKNVEVLSGAAVNVSVLGVTNTTAGESANFVATATNATEITWNFGDGSELATGNEVNHVYDMPGIYTVTTSASNGACAAVSQLNIAVTANVTSFNQIISETVNVYPNPANNFFTLTLNSEIEAVLEITDLTGKLLRTENISGQMPNVISTSELANGIYLLNLKTNNKTETFKLSVSH